MKKFKRSASILTSAGVILGLSAMMAPAASALDYSTVPGAGGNIKVKVTSDDPVDPGTYRVGVCTKENQGDPAIAPACGGYSGDIEVSESQKLVDELTDNIPANGEKIANAHKALPGQDPDFDCGVGVCEVIIVNHDTKDIIERKAIDF